MKKIIFECVNNTILIILLGLILIFPLAPREHRMMIPWENHSLDWIFFVLFFGYLIIYLLIRFFFISKRDWSSLTSGELSVSDEREKEIRSKSVIMAYRILTIGIIFSAYELGQIQEFMIATDTNVSTYTIAICLLMGVLIITTISYCIRWCVEYKK